MAAVETGQPRSHGKGQKKKKRRVGVRIDMTPMVDVALLLLTFFMLTTVFNKPQTMELNLPPTQKPVPIPASSLLTLRVAPDFTIYWSKGDDPNKLQKVPFSEIRKFLIDQDRSTNKMVTLIKIDRDAKYNNMVDLIDEVNLANISRFSIAPMDANDKRLMEKAG
jgi:biopolymer transport protein ExbD